MRGHRKTGRKDPAPSHLQALPRPRGRACGSDWPSRPSQDQGNGILASWTCYRFTCCTQGAQQAQLARLPARVWGLPAASGCIRLEVSPGAARAAMAPGEH